MKTRKNGKRNKKREKKRGKERKKERKKERPKVGNNNGQLRIAMPPRVAYAKPSGPKLFAGLTFPQVG